MLYTFCDHPAVPSAKTWFKAASTSSSGSFLGFKNRTSGTGIPLRSCRLLVLAFNDKKCSKLGIPSASSVALCDISSFICVCNNRRLHHVLHPLASRHAHWPHGDRILYQKLAFKALDAGPVEQHTD